MTHVLPNDLIGTVEAADILGFHVRKVKRLAKSGELPHAHKMPGDTGAYLFARIDVEALARRIAADDLAS